MSDEKKTGMSEEELLEIISRNQQAFSKETTHAFNIIRKDRHSSIEPYEWLGPSEEPRPSGHDCSCAGCHARFSVAKWDIARLGEDGPRP
jgi:hypothetical protein